jgi:hypothetical protein
MASSGISLQVRDIRTALTRERLTSDTALLLYVAGISFVGHLLVAGNYGYFRDELYYIDAGRHLAFGYVEYPPFIALLAFALRIFGDSLLALHFVAALANAALIVVTGLIARQLGGGRFAQLLAAVASASAAVYLGTGSLFTMDVFDELWWALVVYVLILLLKRGEPRLWLVFGLVAGIGLTTKVTMLYLGFGVAVGLLFTPERRYLWTRHAWLGGAIAFAFLLPYLLWNAVNGWPTVEFWANYGGHLAGESPVDFLLSQIVIMNPLTLPLWIAGLVYFFSRAGKPYRALGWTYVVLFVVMALMGTKSYFLAPAYPFLFAGGAVLFAGALARRPALGWAKVASVALLALSGAFLAPGVMPILPPAAYGGPYTLIVGTSGAQQEGGSTPLPQILADRFGWDTMDAKLAAVYRGLPAADRAEACIFTLNYGEAGAVNQLGPQYGLPHAVSGHNNYYYFGPDGCSGKVLITVGIPRADLEQAFGQVTNAGTTSCKYCVDEENGVPIFVARQPKAPIQQLWPRTKHFG